MSSVIPKIIDLVAKTSGACKADILGGRKKRRAVVARRVIVAMAVDITGSNPTSISGEVGIRDPRTARECNRWYRNWLSANPDMADLHKTALANIQRILST